MRLHLHHFAFSQFFELSYQQVQLVPLLHSELGLVAVLFEHLLHFVLSDLSKSVRDLDTQHWREEA